MNQKLRELHVETLFQAVLMLETVPELKALAQRLEVAKMLSEGKVYSAIVQETGASTATISRVNRSLHYGCDGYKVLFERMDRANGVASDE